MPQEPDVPKLALSPEVEAMDGVDRKAAKRAYKQSHRPMGVFRLLNRVNGKSFVGSTVNLPAMRSRLRVELNSAGHLKHPQLQAEWREFGEDAFEFEVLEELVPLDKPGWQPAADLEVLERIWLEKLEPYDERGYNRRPRP